MEEDIISCAKITSYAVPLSLSKRNFPDTLIRNTYEPFNSLQNYRCKKFIPLNSFKRCDRCQFRFCRIFTHICKYNVEINENEMECLFKIMVSGIYSRYCIDTIAGHLLVTSKFHIIENMYIGSDKSTWAMYFRESQIYEFLQKCPAEIIRKLIRGGCFSSQRIMKSIITEYPELLECENLYLLSKHTFNTGYISQIIMNKNVPEKNLIRYIDHFFVTELIPEILSIAKFHDRRTLAKHLAEIYISQLTEKIATLNRIIDNEKEYIANIN